MKKALITGITGQDGAYLAEFLLEKGYEVHGLKRRTSLFNTDRIDHFYQGPHEGNRRFILHHGDLTDSSSLIHVIGKIRPDEIYNLAAQSHVAVSFEEPEYTANSDALGTLRVLEAIRILGLVDTTRFYQASTSELFGKVRETPQTEKTPFYPRSPYAIAKIAGIKMCEAYNRQYGTRYRSVMATNLYGPGDNYHLENSHVIPAMIRKYHLAKLANKGDIEGILLDEQKYGLIPPDIAKAIFYDQDSKKLLRNHTAKVILWGSGSPYREFLRVDDMAAACLHVMNLEQSSFQGGNPSFVNVGVGKDITIRGAAELICEVVGFPGETVFDSTKPDGTARKLLDTARINTFGWQPGYSLKNGLRDAYKGYLHIFNDNYVEHA